MSRHSRFVAALLCLIPATLAAAQATSQQPSVSCQSSWPEHVIPSGDYPVLKQRVLSGNKIEYYGRYKLWSPIGNKLDCRIRQLVFNVGRLANDLPQGTPDGPSFSYVVQHGIFHRPAKNFKLDPNMSILPNGVGFTEYTVDAQSIKPEKGVYYARISIIGSPR